MIKAQVYMKNTTSQPSAPAFTRVDLCVGVATACFLLLLGATATARMQPYSHRAGCANNLKQLGGAIRSYANDHENLAPWCVAPAKGGTAGIPNGSWHFLVLSNYVVSPAIFACPADPEKMPAVNYSRDQERGLLHLTNRAVGYFIATELSMNLPKSILLGDALVNGRSGQMCFGASGSYPSWKVPVLGLGQYYGSWKAELHDRGIGNLLFVDGAVKAVNNDGFYKAIIENPIDYNASGCALMP